MPRKKTTAEQDEAALKAWRGKAPPREPKPGDYTVALKAAIADEATRLHHAFRSRGVEVVIPNDDEPGHPGWRIVGLTENDAGRLLFNITRADQRWTDRPYPDKPHLTRGGSAGWEWFTGQVPVAPSSVMWRDVLRMAGVPRHPLLQNA